MGRISKDYTSVRALANSGELRQVLENAGVRENLINSIVDRCLR